MSNYSAPNNIRPGGTLQVPQKESTTIIIGSPMTRMLTNKVIKLDLWMASADRALSNGTLSFPDYQQLQAHAHGLLQSIDDLITHYRDNNGVKAQHDKMSGRKRRPQQPNRPGNQQHQPQANTKPVAPPKLVAAPAVEPVISEKPSADKAAKPAKPVKAKVAPTTIKVSDEAIASLPTQV